MTLTSNAIFTDIPFANDGPINPPICIAQVVQIQGLEGAQNAAATMQPGFSGSGSDMEGCFTVRRHAKKR